MNDGSNRTILVNVKTDDISQSSSFSIAEITIGRMPDCNIVVTDEKISKRHLKITERNGVVKIEDLGSSNGTFVNSVKIEPGVQVAVRSGDIIHLGSIRTVVDITVFRTAAVPEVKEEPIPVEPVAEKPKSKNAKKIEDKFNSESERVDVNFKNVNVMRPMYQNPSKHAQEILNEAELLKKSIIKNAEMRADIIINEAQKESNKIAQQKIEEYKENVAMLLQTAQLQVSKMQQEAQIEVNELKLNLENEQKQQRKDFEQSLEQEKSKTLAQVTDEETARLEEFYRQKISEKYKQIADEQEAEKHVYQNIINEYKADIDNLELKKLELVTFSQEFEVLNAEKIKTIESLDQKIPKLQTEIAELDTELTEKDATKEKIIVELSELTVQLAKIKNEVQQVSDQRSTNQARLDEINKDLHFKNEELKKLVEQLSSEKALKVQQISEEIKVKKDEEYKKLEEFKKQQAKEFQKINEQHLKTLQSVGPTLSQEIAQKLEIFHKKNNEFSFDKTFEIISSSIHTHFNFSDSKNLNDVKIEEKIAAFRDNQKRKQVRVYFNAFAVYTLFFFGFKFIKEKLNEDPLEKQRRDIAAENQAAQERNKYVIQQNDNYYDNYVENTLYNRSFYQNYMNPAYQKEWMTKVTKHLLKTWKISEEKTIEVVSGSKALVQTIEEMRHNFTKSRFKTENEKLVRIENDLIQRHSSIMGSSVRYEDYKKLEKDFFSKK